MACFTVTCVIDKSKSTATKTNSSCRGVQPLRARIIPLPQLPCTHRPVNNHRHVSEKTNILLATAGETKLGAGVVMSARPADTWERTRWELGLSPKARCSEKVEQI
ncbi:hypothetical protein Bbelb_046740 [Branchiostoma belcheri]|nr:hypothetical protein Bbelb_046740 [Branchiostoma belcheri]